MKPTDRQNRPYARPIDSRQVSPRRALFDVLLFVLLALASSFTWAALR